MLSLYSWMQSWAIIRVGILLKLQKKQINKNTFWTINFFLYPKHRNWISLWGTLRGVGANEFPPTNYWEHEVFCRAMFFSLDIFKILVSGLEFLEFWGLKSIHLKIIKVEKHCFREKEHVNYSFLTTAEAVWHFLNNPQSLHNNSLLHIMLHMLCNENWLRWAK